MVRKAGTAKGNQDEATNREVVFIAHDENREDDVPQTAAPSPMSNLPGTSTLQSGALASPTLS
jgi:hypothetical protein